MIATQALGWLVAIAAFAQANPTIHDTPQQVLSADHMCPDDDTARPNACGPFNSYTALGDSYGCGFASLQRLALCPSDGSGFGSSCTTEACGQDIGGYAWKFRKQHAIKNFQYLACTGNDTQSIIDDQISSPSSRFGNPDLVTISAGGDDQSFFTKVVKACVFYYDSGSCDREMATAAKIIEGLPTQYAKIFAAVKRKVRPNTKVVAMGYAQFWGFKDCPLLPNPLIRRPSLWQKQMMNKLARDMNLHLRTAALKAGYLYGDVDAAFQNHRFCDVQSVEFMYAGGYGWDKGGVWYNEAAPFHPTATGQAFMLRALYNALKCY
jgi:hypothetical protein